MLWILQALQRTLEFEDELAEKFGGGTQSREVGNEIEEIGRQNNSQSASDIRKKYEKKLAAHQGSENEVCSRVHTKITSLLWKNPSARELQNHVFFPSDIVLTGKGWKQRFVCTWSWGKILIFYKIIFSYCSVIVKCRVYALMAETLCWTI